MSSSLSETFVDILADARPMRTVSLTQYVNSKPWDRDLLSFLGVAVSVDIVVLNVLAVIVALLPATSGASPMPRRGVRVGFGYTRATEYNEPRA
jgi:hypothetical protein